MKVPVYVYFLRPLSMAGPTKIGCGRVPTDRLRQAMCWSPIPLEILVTMPGDETLEMRFHQRFLHLRSHSEWFKTSAEIDATVEAIRDGSFDCETLPPPKRLQPFRRRGPEVGRAISNAIRLSVLAKSGVVIPEDVRAARYTYDQLPEEVVRRRAVVAAFVEQHYRLRAA